MVDLDCTDHAQLVNDPRLPHYSDREVFHLTNPTLNAFVQQIDGVGYQLECDYMFITEKVTESR